MSYIINGKSFSIVDSLERISSKDSFTHQDNKIGDGAGAWEWHIGSKNDLSRYNFFGGVEFNIRCFVRKSDLIWLMDQLRNEYENPSYEYRERQRFPEIWSQRVQEIHEISEFEFFRLREHDGRNPQDNRLYARRPGSEEGDTIYGLIRKVALPNITFVSILKLRSDDLEELFYFKIFPEFVDEKNLYSEQAVIDDQLIDTTETTTRIQLIKARIGQGIFRERLLSDCGICPITEVSDSRILVASHIKPWKISNNEERLNEKNGLLFTPTYDKLFDIGFITFENDRRMLISPWISLSNRRKLGLVESRVYPLLNIDGREIFLDYHRSNIFKQ